MSQREEEIAPNLGRARFDAIARDASKVSDGGTPSDGLWETPAFGHHLIDVTISSISLRERRQMIRVSALNVDAPGVPRTGAFTLSAYNPAFDKERGVPPIALHWLRTIAF